MVILLPLLPDEQTKHCSRCPHLGLASPVRERSSFSPTRKRGVLGQLLYASQCRRCDVKRNAEWQRRTAWHRKQARARYLAERRKQPERQERERERQRRAWHAKRARRSPAELAQERAARRERDAFRRARQREEASLPLRIAEIQPGGPGGALLDAAPFQAWLRGLLARAEREAEGCDFWHEDPSLPPQDRVAAWCGCSPRRLREWLRAERVYESVVDRACSREGSLMAHELYAGLLEGVD